MKAFFGKSIAAFAAAVLAACPVAAQAQVQAQATVPVTIDNFARAESDLYFGNAVKDGGFGKFVHIRELTPIDHQTVIRLNRDTLYSSAVFDLDAGPVTVAMPDAGSRFMSLQLIDEDHYAPAVYYGAGTRTLTKDNVGTRYVLVAVRTLVDPNNPQDMRAAHALQDAIRVSQPGGPGRFDVPAWDRAAQNRMRDALLVLAETTGGFRNSFGRKGEVDPVRHLIATAAGWGGNPDKDAVYVGIAPKLNDGEAIHELKVKDVPVDGFWSISVYNGKGYFEKNLLDAYTLNNLTAQKASDGTVTVQFGGCAGKVPNCLPVMKSWNYVVRLYRPRAEILSGAWTFPEAQPATMARAPSFDDKWPLQKK